MKISDKELNNRDHEILEFVFKVGYAAALKHKRRTAEDFIMLDIVDFIKKFKIPVDVLSGS